eukprot:10666184-Alexandrium_andersonii.AAC.1
MSASLVGSEMCIRDSLRRSRRSMGPGRPSSLMTLAGPGPSFGPSKAGAAVSYTHLTLPTICSV